MKRRLALTCVVALFAHAAGAFALDYGSVATPSAILYDGPSLKAKKLYVVSRYTPLELVVNLSEWIKVRSQDGALAWAEKRAIASTRYVVVTAALADVRQSPDPAAALVFQARKQVALELLESSGTGWLKVRHADGNVGYIRALDAWGG